MDEVKITNDEAASLANHLEYYIMQEVRDAGVDYDNLDYLINLVHIYEKCKKFADVEFKGAFLLKEASGIAKVDP